MPKQSKKGLHDRLIDTACLDGWVRSPWKRGIREHAAKEPWQGESDLVEEMLDETPYIPDAWRIQVEGPGVNPHWQYDVMVIELLEVEVNHAISSEKLNHYRRMWWLMDETLLFAFRLFRMDRYGLIHPLVTEKSTIEFLCAQEVG